MTKGRLEAFSDGVLAIIITIMVLELQAPEGTNFRDLLPIIPIFLSYVLSFIYVAIYWINHHHVLMAANRISSKVLWANINLLFWISLIPFTTSWVDENHIEPVPVATYGITLLMCGISFRLFEKALMEVHDKKTTLVKVLEKGWKEKYSILIYLAAIPMAFVHPFISIFCYILVALFWFIPNQELERQLGNEDF